MPIPVQVSEETSSAASSLRLVQSAAPAAAEKASLYISARFFAHLVDLGLVFGMSLYLAKGIALGFLALYASRIHGVGEGAENLFLDLYAYASGQLLAACFGLFSVIYFVAVPAWTARTLGLGLFGLKIVDASGAAPTVAAHARRLLICVLIYVSGGSLLLSSLRARTSSLPQDSFSGTFLKKA